MKSLSALPEFNLHSEAKLCIEISRQFIFMNLKTLAILDYIRSKLRHNELKRLYKGHTNDNSICLRLELDSKLEKSMDLKFHTFLSP